MEELKLLILSKISFISSYSDRKSQFISDSALHNEMMQDLLFEKKRLALSAKTEEKIMQSILQKTIEAPYRIMQFYELSKHLMHAYDPDFLSESDSDDRQAFIAKNPFQKQGQKIGNQSSEIEENFKPSRHLIKNIQNKDSLLNKITKLYQQFFEARNCQNKASQIKYLHNKNLCSKGLLLPTIFCWFNDWVNREASVFLKKEITFLSQLKYNATRQHTSSKKSPIRQKSYGHKGQGDNRSDSSADSTKINLKKSRSKSDLYQKIEKIKQKKSQEHKFNPILYRQKSNRSRPMFLPQEEAQLSKNRKKRTNPIKEEEKESPQKIGDEMQSPTLNEKTVICEDQYPISREVTIGAFYEKYLRMYRSLEDVIPDLEMNFIRNIKKNDRKKQIKKRLKQVSRVFIRAQPLIKRSIDQYQADHFLRQKKARKQKDKQQQQVLVVSENSQQTEGQKKEGDAVLRRQKSSNHLPKSYFDDLLMPSIKKHSPGLKESISLHRPIRFELNLPRIPESSRTYNQNSGKDSHSKVVLIQANRYKINQRPIASIESSTGKLSSRKLTSKSVDLSAYFNSDQSEGKEELILKGIKHKRSAQSIEQLLLNKNSSIKTTSKRNDKLLDKILHKSLDIDSHLPKESLTSESKVVKGFQQLSKMTDSHDYGDKSHRRSTKRKPRYRYLGSNVQQYSSVKPLQKDSSSGQRQYMSELEQLTGWQHDFNTVV